MTPPSRREQVFLQAFPFAVRAARARSAAAATVCEAGFIDWEDFMQEALIAVWVALPRFDSTRATLRTFVERIVASKIRSVLRRARAAKRTKRDLPGNATLVWDMVAKIELQLDLLRVLRGLPSRDKQVAYLACENHPTEIARILRTSRAGVYRSIDRIKTALAAAGFKASFF
jgi:RNA polymerase sigma factor (sigma-70 family)